MHDLLPPGKYDALKSTKYRLKSQHGSLNKSNYSVLVPLPISAKNIIKILSKLFQQSHYCGHIKISNIKMVRIEAKQGSPAKSGYMALEQCLPLSPKSFTKTRP